MIRAVTFDFWATLYIYDSDSEERRKRLRVERLRLVPALQHIEEERFREEIRAARQKAMAAGRQPIARELPKYLLAELEVDYDAELAMVIATILEDAILDAPPPPVPGALRIVQRLARCYRIGLISDTGLSSGRTLRHILEREGFADSFSAMTFSDETGHAKPDRWQFVVTAAKLGIRPEQMAHVGDLVETDIVGARSVGAKAILYTGVHDDQAGKDRADAIIRDLAELPDVLGLFNAASG